jgi:glycosyltransferase involved in cell wall biosynthesis
VAGAAREGRRGGARVLMLVRLFHPWIGGTERQAHELARALVRTGAEVQVVTGRWFRGTSSHETIDDVPVTRNFTLWEFLGIRGLRKFGGYLYMCTLLWHLWRRRATYDVIHVHGLNYHTAVAVVAGRWFGKPVLAKLANSGAASDITRMRQGRQLAGSGALLSTALACDRFVALNPAVVAELTAAGVPRSRIVEIPNGVEVPADLPTREELHVPPCVLYVGRLHEQKGLDVLLRAFAQLEAEEVPDPVLRLVGEGPAEQQLRELAGELGIEDRVDLVGRRDDVDPLLREADVFVLPSHVEGLSNSLLEAMAVALPVVASDIPGNRVVVRHGHNGLLVPPGDVPALAASLARLLRDRQGRRAMGTAARRTILPRYGIERVAGQYLDLYRILHERSPDAPAATVPSPEGARP